ncbi:MAG: hypothetical protein ABI307_13110 [Mycobacterium sp.]
MIVRFAKPSAWRVLWSIVAVAVMCCIITGIAVDIGFVLTHNETEHTPTGDYVRLFVVSIAFYAPMFLQIVWQVSIPVILALGLLLACMRKSPTVESSPTPPAR